MIYELNHFGIVVKNLEKTLAFYQNVLGAEIVFQGFIEASKTDIVYIRIANGLLEFLHRADAPADEKFGISHIAFLSDALDADYDRLVNKLGYKGLVAPKKAGTGVGRLAFIEDPNGARVELLERDTKMRDKPVKDGIIKAFDHYSVLANDGEGALKFYRDAFGMKLLQELVVPHPTNPLTMYYMHWDYDVLELSHRPEPDTVSPIFGHYALRLELDSVEKAKDYFLKHGVQPLPGTPKRAGTGLGNILLVADPDGVKIELVDRADLHDLPKGK